MSGPLRCPCAGAHLRTAWAYDAPPEGETPFPVPAGGYHREVLRCAACDHFVCRSAMDLSALYEGDYVTATYGGAEGMRRAFARITGLPAGRSDNRGRVRRVVEGAGPRLARPAREGRPPEVLDVGSGLAVFPHALAAEGWRCTALDPDPRAAEHARAHAGVPAVCADFMTAAGLGAVDLVTLNKVIEHVQDPVGMLARAAALAGSEGLVYAEVPDGPGAAAGGPGREEFFAEHLHVFSAASLAMAAARAGLSVVVMEAVREPSGKFTLFAFLRPGPA